MKFEDWLCELQGKTPFRIDRDAANHLFRAGYSVMDALLRLTT